MARAEILAPHYNLPETGTEAWLQIDEPLTNSRAFKYSSR